MYHALHLDYQLDSDSLKHRLKLDQDLDSNDNILKVFSQVEKDARLCIKLRGMYVEGHHVTGIPEVDRCQKQILVLVFITQEVLNQMDQYTKEEKYLEAYLMNEMANDVLFAASDQANQYLCQMEQKEGRNLTRAFFPGDHDLPIEKQSHFINILTRERIQRDLPEETAHKASRAVLGITTNEYDMLVPEKAMIYAFGSDSSNQVVSVTHDCSHCQNLTCIYRKE